MCDALKGKNNGGGVPLGYLLDKKAQKLVIDPVTAPLVVEVFEKYADGKSVRSIVEDFNARGLKTKRGQPFNINSFSSLLKNRKYIGEYYDEAHMKRNSPETARVSGLFLRLRIENHRISNDRLTALTAYRPFRPRQHSPKTAPPTMSAAPMICSGDMVSFRIKTDKTTANSGSR